MAEYQLTSNPEMVFRRADQVWIPTHGSNADYRAYLEWLAEGNEPDPADPVPERAPPP